MKLPGLPPYLEGRVAVLLLITPLPAGAVCAVMGKKLYFWLVDGALLSAGDITVGLPLGALLAVALIAIGVRSFQVYCGAQSRWAWVFRLAPFIALAGVVMGLLANAGR